MSVEDTLAQRGKTHGSFIDNGRIMQALKNQVRQFIKEDGINPWDMLPTHYREALDMICHKIGRILSGDPRVADHWHDIAGYATLIEREILDKNNPSR